MKILRWVTHIPHKIKNLRGMQLFLFIALIIQIFLEFLFSGMGKFMFFPIIWINMFMVGVKCNRLFKYIAANYCKEANADRYLRFYVYRFKPDVLDDKLELLRVNYNNSSRFAFFSLAMFIATEFFLVLFRAVF
jgi:hypothetical protein